MDRQVGRLTSYVLDENRKGLKSLLSIIEKEPIDYLVVDYKDRLARFGYNYLKTYCRSHGVEMMTIEQQKKKELNDEMIEDLISIMTSFSFRLYGRRGSLRKLKRRLQS